MLAARVLAAVGSAQVLDRVVASVNGRPILMSRVDDQARLAAFFDGRSPEAMTEQDRAATLNRVVDQLLLREQMAKRDSPSFTEQEVAQRIGELFRAGHAGSNASLNWRPALAAYGLRESDAIAYVRAQMEELQFVEQRFQPSVRLSEGEIENFYRSEYLPKLRERGAAARPLEEVRAPIEKVLTERQITTLYTAWLQSLRSAAGVHILEPITASDPEGH